MKVESMAIWHPAEGALVTAASAEMHAKMEAIFGLPEISGRLHDEQWFGPYHVDGDTRFWRFDLSTDRWSVSTASEPPRPVVHTLDPVDEESMHEAFNYARQCPPPGLPNNPNAEATTKSFTLSGWRFCWFYFPELARWELASRGRA